MLSLFPELLFLAPFSALLLRAALVYFLLRAAYKHFTRVPDVIIRALALLECAASLALFLGAYAQMGALTALLVTITWLLFPRIRPFPRTSVALLLVLSLSILITGPGAIAFDIPL